MSTTRIYTEEQVRAMLDKMEVIYSLEDLTPIELPTDKEIEQEAHVQYPVNLQPNGRTLAGGRYDVDINYGERRGFMNGAKWMRDKIQGGNK